MPDYMNQSVFQPSIPKHLMNDEDRRYLEAFSITFEPDGEDKFYLYADTWCCSAYLDSKEPGGKEIELNEDDLFARFQEIIRRSNGELPWISKESAYTCSEMRSEGFGGGAVFITATDIKYCFTGQWLEERIKEAETRESNLLGCPACGCILEVSRTDTLLGIDREIFDCQSCDETFIRDLTVAESPIERAVKCAACGQTIPFSSAHVISQRDNIAHYLGDCCWDERQRD
jgi:ribosomal protein L37AE/L43A